jgi:cyclic beta-1,2-glucan synthetase
LQAVARLGRGAQAGALLNILNPVRHAETPDQVRKYKVEPYVVAADVYGRPPHVGRGGWTWYTGSAGWLYQVALGDVLGLRRRGDRLRLSPCIPAAWDHYEIAYRFGTTLYEIVIDNPEGVERGVVSVEVDGAAVEGDEVPLRDDGGVHQVVVVLGAGTGITAPSRQVAQES